MKKTIKVVFIIFVVILIMAIGAIFGGVKTVLTDDGHRVYVTTGPTATRILVEEYSKLTGFQWFLHIRPVVGKDMYFDHFVFPNGVAFGNCEGECGTNPDKDGLSIAVTGNDPCGAALKEATILTSGGMKTSFKKMQGRVHDDMCELDIDGLANGDKVLIRFPGHKMPDQTELIEGPRMGAIFGYVLVKLL